MPKRIGVILAGGESRRFGSPKAFAHYHGQPFYNYVKEAIQPFVEQVLIISKPELSVRFQMEKDVLVLTDAEAYKGKGPLAGIYTAMAAVNADEYLVFPCDTPLINKAYIQWILKKAERHSEVNGVVPVVENRLHPLMGVYRKDVFPYLKELLDTEQLRMRALIDNADILQAEVDAEIDLRTFFNINTQDQLNALN